MRPGPSSVSQVRATPEGGTDDASTNAGAGDTSGETESPEPVPTDDTGMGDGGSGSSDGGDTVTPE